MKKKKIIIITKVLMFILLIGVFFPTNIINHIYEVAEDPYLNYVLIYIRAGSFLIVLLFAFPTFLWLLIFFIKKKSL